MIKTTYICDKCQGEQPTSNQFWNVGVWATSVGSPYNDDAKATNKSIQVCRPCLESFGLYVQPTNPKAAELKARSTDDILVELLERVGK